MASERGLSEVRRACRGRDHRDKPGCWRRVGYGVPVAGPLPHGLPRHRPRQGTVDHDLPGSLRRSSGSGATSPTDRPASPRQETAACSALLAGSRVTRYAAKGCRWPAVVTRTARSRSATVAADACCPRLARRSPGGSGVCAETAGRGSGRPRGSRDQCPRMGRPMSECCRSTRVTTTRSRVAAPRVAPLSESGAPSDAARA